MKCLCKRTCQTRIGGKITFVKRGEVKDLEECSPHFVSLEDTEAKVDFSTATEEELMATKWGFGEAAEATLKLYGIELVKEDGTKKSDVVEAILDARYRFIHPSTLG